jgi:hypothetical protein
MIWGIIDEAHSLSYVTNRHFAQAEPERSERQPAKQPGEMRRCKGYFLQLLNTSFFSPIHLWHYLKELSGHK